VFLKYKEVTETQNHKMFFPICGLIQCHVWSRSASVYVSKISLTGDDCRVIRHYRFTSH